MKLGSAARILKLKGFARFFVVGEERVFGEISEIVKIANRCNQILKHMVKEFNLDTLTVENQKMSELEKNSDGIALRIRREIVDGAVNPTVLDNLLESVETADSMVDDYHYLARELTRIARVEPKVNCDRVPTLDSSLLALMDLLDGSLAKVSELLAENDYDEMRQERREIEHLEEQGDEVKDDAIDELYRLASDMHYINFTHYGETIHKLDDILDACEDLSDLVVAIVMSVSK